MPQAGCGYAKLPGPHCQGGSMRACDSRPGKLFRCAESASLGTGHGCLTSPSNNLLLADSWLPDHTHLPAHLLVTRCQQKAHMALLQARDAGAPDAARLPTLAHAWPVGAGLLLPALHLHPVRHLAMLLLSLLGVHAMSDCSVALCHDPCTVFPGPALMSAEMPCLAADGTVSLKLACRRVLCARPLAVQLCWRKPEHSPPAACIVLAWLEPASVMPATSIRC